MSSIQPAQHKSPLVPSLFKTIRSGYSLGMLSKDVSAGITVGVVALPLALAFAIASGLTPERGLYTSIIAGFFMAFFSGSRFPVSGPTGAFVVIIYSIVSRHGYEGLVLTTLMAGILLVIFLALFGLVGNDFAGQIYPLPGDHGLHHRDCAADLLLADEGFLRAAACRYPAGVF